MSKIDLEKRVQKVTIILEKHNIPVAPVMRIGLALDVSGSAKSLYTSGIMQQAVDRLLAVACKFDDNGEMDMYVFDDQFHNMPSAKANDYEGWIDRNILKGNIRLWGGTQFSGILEDAVEFYFPTGKMDREEKKGFFSKLFSSSEKTEPNRVVNNGSTDIPALLMLVTDGENSDQTDTEAIIRSTQKLPIYIHCVGVGGNANFGFLESMADKYPNVGFVNLSSLNISDEDLYSQIICDELCEWVKKLPSLAQTKAA